MTTINVSNEAYKRILKRKQEIEDDAQAIISISMAVDDLLKVNILEVKNRR